MSQTVTFAELVNLAIGTPELGNVNFNALHFLLHSMLRHLRLQDEPKEISEDELDFIKPPPRNGVAAVAPEPETLVRRSSSLFHQMHERITALERQLHFLNDTPSTAELLARTQTGLASTPAQDMWQLMQLKKKMETNEEGMNKAMKTLQDLLANICSLKTTTEDFEAKLGQLKDDLQNLGIEEMQEQLKQLDIQAKSVDDIQRQMSEVKSQPPSMPDLSDVVRWSTLCDLLLGKSSPEMDREARVRVSQELLASMGEMPKKHEALLDQIAQLEERLRHQAHRLESHKTLAKDKPEMMALLKRIDSLESQDRETKESLAYLMGQIPKLKEQLEKMENIVHKLKRSSADIQNIQNSLEHLTITKADKALIREEMDVKADKSALEAKVNHLELSSATSQLNEMLQEMLQKMSLQDKDWQKALQKLFSDMDCKLDRMALDPLSRQLEEVWQFIKQYLSEGPRFDADSAAGFKKQLFERVKCLSCDRPVTLMTGPHLLTVQKAQLKPRPASANGYEYLAQRQKGSLETGEGISNLPPQTCWQCQAHHQSCTIKRSAKSRDYATLYPYGDPTALTYDNAEVDILGVDGILYKGRVNPQTAERTLEMQKAFFGVKLPRPPSVLRMDRARSAVVDVTYMSPSASSTVRRSKSAAEPPCLLPVPSPDSVGRMVFRSSSFSQHSLQNGGRVPGT